MLDSFFILQVHSSVHLALSYFVYVLLWYTYLMYAADGKEQACSTALSANVYYI